MKRLTEQYDLNYTVGKAQSDPTFFINCLKQLREYENTNLTPSQIDKLKVEYIKLKSQK